MFFVFRIARHAAMNSGLSMETTWGMRAYIDFTDTRLAKKDQKPKEEYYTKLVMDVHLA